MSGTGAQASMSSKALSREAPRDPWIGAWLIAICVCVVAMIIVGGATRLTDSGLSITEWNLEKGLTPPLTAARWNEEFALYQRTVEYQRQNAGMSLADFQNIYWWEWAHRFLGKMIGLVFALPYIFFAFLGRLKGRFWSVTGLFILGGMQGAVGWWMVTSGLFSALDVSPLRLAVHLGMAFAILGIGLWLALGAFGWPGKEAQPGAPRWLAALLLVALFGQILFGAILAGADGGKAFADWPTIGGQIVPAGPFEGALAQNHATQQFIHRTLGYGVALLALVFAGWGLARGRGASRATAAVVGLLALGQAGLGIVTVIHAAPVGLSLAHQAGAILLWIASIAAFRVAVKSYLHGNMLN